MGQKVNPHGLRVGVIKDWDSKWFSEDKFADYLVEDYNIRKLIKEKLFDARISKIEIERKADKIKVSVYTSRAGFITGRASSANTKGKNANKKDAEAPVENKEAEAVVEPVKEDPNKETPLKAILKDLKKLCGQNVDLDIIQIKKPDADAQLVAENIAKQLENRVSFRRAIKSAMSRTMKKDNKGNSTTGALGIKAAVSGRLGGADMARSEFYSEGTIPLQTLRADIDYGFAEADTTYGKLGVKVWIYRGEVLPTKGNKEGSDK